MSVIARSATVCARCWQVVAIDGENNRERIGALCSHLGPMVELVPSTTTQGAVEDAAELVRLAHLPDKAMAQGDWLRLRELTRRYAPDHPANERQ